MAVQETEAVVTVTKVDRETRTVTFRGPQGNVGTLTVPPESQNLDQVKPGQQYRMKYMESVAVEIRKGGAPSASAGEQVKLAPKGSKPGGVMVRTQQIAGVVDAVDYTNRSIAVRGPKGSILALKVADDVKLEELSAGDRISVTQESPGEQGAGEEGRLDWRGGLDYSLATVFLAALLAAGCEKEAPAPQAGAAGHDRDRKAAVDSVQPHLRRADRELAPAMGGGWVDASDAIAKPSMGPKSNTPSGSR